MSEDMRVQWAVADLASARPESKASSRHGLTVGDVIGRIWVFLIWSLVIFFLLNIAAIVAAVVINSFGTHWFNSWLPPAFTARWYGQAWDEFQLPDILWVTAEVIVTVVLVSGLIGVPAAYVLARREFPGKRAAMFLMLLPLVVPPMTYGIPMATFLYQIKLGGTIWGVILANLVPTVPFVILVMVPFIEQIDSRLEDAARVAGAGLRQLFMHVLVPLLAPGMVAALLMAVVRTIGMFDLTFLAAGQNSETLVVALFYSVFSAGIRPTQMIDAVAVVYMAITLTWLLVAMLAVNPAHMVGRIRRG